MYTFKKLYNLRDEMAYILIDSSAFFHNLDLIVKKLGSIQKVAIVLKDNAYGHGLSQMANLANKYGIKRAVVRNIQEALLINNLFDHIHVLGELPIQKMPNSISFAINDLASISSLPNGVLIDVKVDTGMHRNGIMLSELEDAFSLAKRKDLKIVSIFTHFRSADELSSELFWQIQNFNEVKRKTIELSKRFDFKIPLFHSHNSAATLRQNSIDDDFVRIGIASYGYSELAEIFGKFDLRPVLSLWAKRVSTRSLKKGSKVGYGNKGIIDKDMVISSYDIGYGDGLFRINENMKLHTECNKQIIGRTSMDYVSVEGDSDEVCIFRDVRRITKAFNTISYDQLVKLSPNIPRKVI